MSRVCGLDSGPTAPHSLLTQAQGSAERLGGQYASSDSRTLLSENFHMYQMPGCPRLAISSPDTRADAKRIEFLLAKAQSSS